MSQAIRPDIAYRTSCFKYLGDLIARRDFVTAIRYFESIQDAMTEQRDYESGRIMRLAARAYGSSNKFTRALQLIRTAIAAISNEIGETDELAECYLVLGDIFRDMSKLDDAEKAYRDAESIFRRGGNTVDAGRALNRISGILFWKGDLQGALQCLLEAVETAKRENNKKRLAYLFGNIGRVYTMLGRLTAAESNLRLNVEVSGEVGDDIETARAWLSLGYVQLQMMNFESARESLDMALPMIQQLNMIREKAIYLTYSGELELKSGHIENAEVNLNEAYQAGLQVSDDSFLAARPLRHLADVYIARANFRKALSLANRALSMMNKINDALEVAAIFRIQAICYEHLGRHQAALRAFRKSINMLEKRQAKFELADSLAAAGKSEVFRLSQKTMLLCRAEELYDYCHIKPRVREIQKCIGECETTSSATSAPSRAGEAGSFPTQNRKMKKIVSQLRLLRNSDLPILLTGETGTGKDYLARYFHSLARPEGPYIAVNCAAVPDSLIESELFGYQRGAFTGADTDKTGLFLAANHGVLLLDEVGELPLTLQAKLLNVLEEKKLRPLGTAKEVELDIVVIAATNCNLEEMVENGTFRRDLYYRLAGITFELPPLRERKEDIPHLLRLFMKNSGLLNGNKPEPELVSQFISYDWPGNIRQLQNKVKQLAALSSMAREGSVVELSRSFFEDKQEAETVSLFDQVERFEKKLLTEALLAANGNKSEAARLLNIHESTLRAKMKRYDMTAMVN